MKGLIIGLIALAILIAAIIALALLPPKHVEADGGHGVCDGGIVSVEGTQDLVIYNAGPGVVEGVCLKAGNTQLHTLYVTDFISGCYTVEGIGTSVVTVTRKGVGRACQGISHIDVLTAFNPGCEEECFISTPTPTPTPLVTPIPVLSVTPIPMVTPETTLTPTLILPTIPPTLEMPLALPNTGAGGSDGGGMGWLDVFMLVVGTIGMAVGIVMIYNSVKEWRKNK